MYCCAPAAPPAPPSSPNRMTPVVILPPPPVERFCLGLGVEWLGFFRPSSWFSVCNHPLSPPPVKRLGSGGSEFRQGPSAHALRAPGPCIWEDTIRLETRSPFF